MKKKLVLATVVAAIMMLGLVGCGVKITNIVVPERATMEKGESITLPVQLCCGNQKAENVRQYYKDLSRSRFFLDWLF